MSDTSNAQIVLRERPVSFVNPSLDPSHPGTFALQYTPVPTYVPQNHVLVKVLYHSVDPAMRGWIKESRSYVEPVKLGDVMRAHCAGIVISSNDDTLKKGDHVTGLLGLQNYALMDARSLEKVEITDGIDAVDYLGVLGLTTLTAYFGVLKVLEVKEGDVVIVTAAAGSTGAAAAQIAKIKGCKG